MAVTKIKGINVTVEKAISYIINPAKTDGKLLVSGFQVEPPFAAYEFNVTAELAKELNGDYTKTGAANVLAYHLIQSFSKKDVISADQAHEVGKRLADEVLQGKHEYVLATHIDKGHIHNHIIFNSVSYLDHKKFRSEPYKTVAKLREVSDRLCAEFGLDVIAEPAGHGVGHKEWQENEKGASWKSRIRKEIDDALWVAGDYQEFLVLMKDKKIEVKEGVHLAFRLEGQERFVRGKTIGERYTREGIQSVLSKQTEKARTQVERNRNTHAQRLGQVRRVPMTLDMQVKYRIRQQQLKDTKELAEVLLLLRKEGIKRFPDIDIKLGVLRKMTFSLKENIKQLDLKKGQYKEASKQLTSHQRLFPIWQEYSGKRGGEQKTFLSNHESDLRAFKYVQAQLQKSAVNSAVDPEKVDVLISHITGQIEVIRRQCDEIERRVKSLQSAQKKVKITMADRDYHLFGVGEKTDQQASIRSSGKTIPSV